jgi:hypothetical protein
MVPEGPETEEKAILSFFSRSGLIFVWLRRFCHCALEHHWAGGKLCYVFAIRLPFQLRRWNTDYAVASQIGVARSTRASCAVAIDKARLIDKSSLLILLRLRSDRLDCERDDMRKMCIHVSISMFDDVCGCKGGYVLNKIM